MKKIMLILQLCGTLFNIAVAQQANLINSQFDKILAEQFPYQQTGGVVLVSSHGKIIYKKAFGMANLELNVPMQTNNVFRIGSITKQFTAIAILQLFEKGLLNLQDEITRFIPNYPVNTSKITIENLLTHTSGIRDFTTIKDSTQRSRMDFTPTQMIHYFQNQPLRFQPGTKYEYSNSNYFLLGYIIEKITGKSYQQYIEENIFRPLGMTNSFYGNDEMIIKNRATGYTISGKEIENTEAMSMSQPYAAGALLSTVDDLFKWQQAINSYKLVKKETVGKAFTNFRLSTGAESSYGYGWRFGFIQESPSIWHGGLISGFTSMAMYLPKEDVYVVVLTNCDCNSPQDITAKLAAAAIRKPYAYKEIIVPDSILKTYTGVYENEDGDQQVISVDSGRLYSQIGRNRKMNVKPFTPERFFFDDPMITMEFSANTTGKIDRLLIHSRTANEVWRKSDKPLRVETEIKLDDSTLSMYVGEYEMRPQFTFTITKDGNRLFVQATGQPKLELFAETSNRFFLKENDARFEFVVESGKISKVMLKQGGRTADAVKIK